jgi:hypothetical protein
MTTDDAKAVLQDLETKLAGARQRHDETLSEAQSIAFAAHTGDVEARKKLDKLNADAGKHGAEILSLEAAIIEARRRVREAEAAVADEAEDARARQALDRVDTLAAHGKALDEALEALKERYAEFSADYRRLGLLGYGAPSWALVAVNCRTALLTGLMGGDLQIEHIAPGARKTYRAVVEGWAANVRARATARLNRNKDAAKAA